MRVLLMNQFFWPDESATSLLLEDVARRLAAEGHEVHVICSAAKYTATEGQQPPPAVIHRVGSRRFSRSKLGRVLSYANFYVLAAVQALRVPRPDVVMTLTTPPLLSLLGNLLKLLRGSRHVIWEMDMYPDVAIDVGFARRGGIFDRVVGGLADFSRSHADRIVALGECMRDRLTARGVPAERIDVVDNWADSTRIQVLPKQDHAERFVVLYSGNLGLAHDIDTIGGAMRNLRDDPRFLFVFIGNGGRRQELAAFAAAEGVESLQLRSYVERSELSRELAQSDVGLVLQSDACCGSVVPSKVYGLLASGRPILFVGPAAATPARIIRRFACGWHIPCGDVEGLTALLRRLAASPDEVAEAARRAREALVQHFDLPLGTARITAVLTSDAHARAAEVCTTT